MSKQKPPDAMPTKGLLAMLMALLATSLNRRAQDSGPALVKVADEH